MPSTNPIDLSLYLVLDPVLCGGEDGMIETARAACAGGATVVQLRAPGWKKRQLVECGRALKTVLAPYHVPLIVDDDADVCLAVNADGLHVGQRDLAPEDARAIIGGDCILGLSVTTLAELTAADTTPIDYFGVGPVFATPTKTDAEPACGLDGLQAITRAARLPTVAIGGIKAFNAADIVASGADGIAVVSAVCGQPDPKAAAEKLLAIVKAAQITP